jgi:hypothetical protein
MSPTNSTSSSCGPSIPGPIPLAKVTRRVSPLSRRSTTSQSVMAGTKRCGCSAFRRKAFQTWAWLRMGVTPGGLTGEVKAVVNEKGMVGD